MCVTAQLEAGLVQRRAALFQTNSSRKLTSVWNSWPAPCGKEQQHDSASDPDTSTDSSRYRNCATRGLCLFCIDAAGISSSHYNIVSDGHMKLTRHIFVSLQHVDTHVSVVQIWEQHKQTPSKWFVLLQSCVTAFVFIMDTFLQMGLNMWPSAHPWLNSAPIGWMQLVLWLLPLSFRSV